LFASGYFEARRANEYGKANKYVFWKTKTIKALKVLAIFYILTATVSGGIQELS